MKIKLIRILIIIFILIFIFYSILWFFTAKNFKNFALNSLNVSRVIKDTNESNFSIKGYPFQFKLVLPKYNFNINPKTNLTLNHTYISSNIFNLKKLSIKSKSFSIYTYLNNFSTELRSINFETYIFLNQKNKIYKIIQKLLNPLLLFKIDGIDKAISVDSITNILYIRDNNLNLVFNAKNIGISDISKKTTNNSFYLDMNINEVYSFKFSDVQKTIEMKNKKIQFNNIIFNNKNISIESKGFLSIDDKMNLNGKLNLVSGQPMQIINYLYKKNILNFIQLNALKLIISNYEDTDRKINIPISFKSNLLYVGPIFITTLPSINKFLF